MGLATVDPHSVKEHPEFHKIPKFGVNRPNNKQDTAVRQRPSGHTFLCKIWTFSNGCILLIIGSIYTKLGDFVKLGKLFHIMWINSC